ncbi:hypothetical protein LOY46_13700 [Pseudomonas sichuanensis]|uniref:hypothetical protein n=1 Tax=Pseudomonas sichuanensis TaxID=2213015 RepID=UPI002160709A|nr:hypothetical protein [Pseudomonas sichuanensis]UVK80650.1 hypothetical protein LOY46_13700 [Pseudomonas sichuanensis]
MKPHQPSGIASKTTFTSKPLLFKVVRNVETDFPSPLVLEAEKNVLDPRKAMNGATVRVQYEGMAPSDSLHVSWVGLSAADSFITAGKPGTAIGVVDFIVPSIIVMAGAGNDVVVHYEVSRAGFSTASAPLDLRIETVAGHHFEDFETLPIGDESDEYARPFMKVLRVSGKMTGERYAHPPFVSGTALRFDHAINLVLNFDVRHMTFGYSGSDLADTDVYAYDVNDRQVAYQHVPNQPGFMTLETLTPTMRSVRFLTSRTLYLDNIFVIR